MDIRGIWKVKEIRVPTPDGVKVFTPDNPPQEERFEGSAELMNYRTEFAEDGMLNTLMFVPEEMRQEAAKQGVEVREDGYAAIESTTWKEADGKFYYDTGIQGETLGEPVDPFMEISVTEDGCLLYGLESNTDDPYVQFINGRGLLRQASFRKAPNEIRCLSERKDP